MYTGDPMLCGTGVDPDDSLGTMGRTARAEPLPGEQKSEWDRALYGGGTDGAIRKGPGELWRVPDPTAKLFYLVLPPGALDALDQHAADLCSKERESFRYVWIDPEKLTGSGDISGKTLAFVFSSQVNAVNDDREDLTRACFLPCLGMVYRMLLAVKNPAGVYVPGVQKVLPILKRFLVTLETGAVTFIAPQLEVKWGDMFEPSDADEATRVQTATSAVGKLITRKTAIDHVKSVFNIENTDQYVDELEKELDDNQQKAIANAQAISGPKDQPGDGAAPALPGAAKAPLPKRGAGQQKSNGKSS
jgi:hypothetical protein